jgi:hypothetical protein
MEAARVKTLLETLTVAAMLKDRNDLFVDLAMGTQRPQWFLERLASRRANEAELRGVCERLIEEESDIDSATELIARLDEFARIYDRDFLGDHVKLLRAATHRYPDDDGLNDLYLTTASRHRDVLEERKKQKRTMLSEVRDKLQRQIAESTKHVEELRVRLADVEAELSQ